MTPLHDEHAAVVAIANRLFERDEAAWRRLLAVAHALDVTLLALIYHRLRAVRDDVAREAFERQLTSEIVARERLEQLAAARGSNERLQKVPILPGVVSPRNCIPEAANGETSAKVGAR